MSCETDILGPGSPVRTLAPRCIENAILRSRNLASGGTLIGNDCLNWRQLESMSRSLFSQHSRMPRQIALINPPVTDLVREFPNNCSVPGETHLQAAWNKRSTLWLYLVRGNVVFKQRNSM
jgi:hypothetical protein